MNTEPQDIKFTQRFSTNLISNIVYFVLNIAIGLALVPFFLHTLGPAAYGLIPLATSLTSYITLVIDALNTSIARYLTIDLQRGDMGKAGITFNTAVFGTLGIMLLLIPVALAGAWYAPAFFQTGEQNPIDVFFLFALIFGSVLIRAWSSNFMVILFARNRLDLRNYVNCVNLGSQVIFIVLLFSCAGVSLAAVGVSYITAAVITLILSYSFSKKICPELTIHPHEFDKNCLREIGGMSVWVLINGVSMLLNTQIALIIVNKLFGEVAGTEYSLAAAWSTLLIGLASLLTNLFTPMIYSLYAKESRTEILKFTSMVIKVVGLIVALPVGLVCIFSSQLLTLWVGPGYSHLAPLIWICISPVILQIMVSCISPITVSHNRVRGLVLLTLPTGALNIILALYIPSIFPIGIYGVALAGLITLLLRYGVLNPLYIAHVIEVPLLYYLKKMLYGIGGLMALSLAGLAFVFVIPVSGLTQLIFAASGISVVYLCLLRIVLRKDERQAIRMCLPKGLATRIPKKWF